MVKEKNWRNRANAFEDGAAQAEASPDRLAPQDQLAVATTSGPLAPQRKSGEWTVRLENDEPGQPALAARMANLLDRALVFPASQMNGSLADELASRFGMKPIWQAAGFGPRLPASAAGGFGGDAPDETIRMGRTNTMLYL